MNRSAPHIPALPLSLRYDAENDLEIYRSGTLALGELLLNIDLCTMAGAPQVGNEDALAARLEGDVLFLGAFDGSANSLVTPEFAEQGINGARFASHTLKRLFETTPCRGDLRNHLIFLNEKLAEETGALIERSGITPKLRPTATATIAKIDVTNSRLDFAHVADSQLITFLRDGSSVLLSIDQVAPRHKPQLEFFEKRIKELRKPPREVAEMAEMKALIKEGCIRLFNAPDGSGFGVMNGDPVMERYIQTGSVPLENITALLLATDGLLAPGDDPYSQAIHSRLMKNFLAGGLRAVTQHTMAIEADDPEFYKVKRFKFRDDKSGYLIQFKHRAG